MQLKDNVYEKWWRDGRFANSLSLVFFPLGLLETTQETLLNGVVHVLSIKTSLAVDIIPELKTRGCITEMKFLFLGVILLDGELVIKYLYSLLASNKTCILQEHNHISVPKKRSMILNKNDIKATEWQLLWITCSRIMTSNYTNFFHLQSWLDIKLSQTTVYNVNSKGWISKCTTDI